MKNHARAALLATCPELYGLIDVSVEPVTEIRFEDQNVKKVFPNTLDSTSKNEIEMSKMLQPISQTARWMPTIHEVGEREITMERIDGSHIQLPFDPEGDERDETTAELAQKLVELSAAITAALDKDGPLVHGDYGLNNIIERNGELIVLDFANSSIADSSKQFANISQLIARLWFNRPLLQAVFVAHVETLSSEEEVALFKATLMASIEKKLGRGVDHYDKAAKDNEVMLLQMERNLLELVGALS